MWSVGGGCCTSLNPFEDRLAGAVAGGPGLVRLADERRYGVPVVLVCPEFTPDQAKEWIAAGDLPELANAKHLGYVDIDSATGP
jgi:hypothetical protein